LADSKEGTGDSFAGGLGASSVIFLLLWLYTIFLDLCSTSRLAVAVFAPVNPAGIVWVLVASHLYLYKISVKKSVVLGKCS
jgi:hypothetical protein